MKKISLQPLRLQDISAHRQFIYGATALWIMFYHMNSSIPFGGVRTILRLVKGMGACGVEVFLLLTGYGLYCALNRNPDVVRFYKRRLVRVLLPALVVFCGYDLLVHPRLFGEAITLKALLFLPWSGRMWYVSFILAAYLCYPLLHKWNVPQKRKGWYTAFIAFFALAFSLEFLPVGLPKEFLRAFTRIPVFLLSCMLALPVQENRSVPRWLFFALLPAAAMGVVIRKFSGQGDLAYGWRMLAYLCLAVAVILLLTRIAVLLQKCAAGRKAYSVFFFCGSISLEIYLVFDRVRELTEFIPGIAGFASPAKDMLSALITIPLAYLLRRLCLWIADGLNGNWKIR